MTEKIGQQPSRLYRKGYQPIVKIVEISGDKINDDNRDNNRTDRNNNLVDNPIKSDI